MSDPIGPGGEPARPPPGYRPHPWTAPLASPVGPFPADPAWVDERPGDHLTVRTADVRASLARHAAARAAEAKSPAAPPVAAQRTQSRRPAAGQASFLADRETSTDGQYDQEAAPAQAKARPVARSRR